MNGRTPHAPADLVFGACNAGAAGETLLSCSVLDPQRDERVVSALLELGDYRARLQSGPYTLRGPRDCKVELMRGPRAGHVRDLHGIGPDDEARIPIGPLGPMPRADVEAMLAQVGLVPSFDLPPTRAVLILEHAEVRQMILRVTPTGRHAHGAFLAVVKHWGDRQRKRFIGSFSALFC